MRKRIFAVFMTLVMVLAAVPQAFAAEQKAALPKLGVCTNLRWGTGDGSQEDDSNIPFAATFDIPTLYQGIYRLEVFRKASAGDELVWDTNYHDSRLVGKTETSLLPVMGDGEDQLYQSGTYYFEVTLEGDGVKYSDGDTARSPEWYYTSPAKRLNAPTKPVWNWPAFSCTDDNADRSKVLGFDSVFYWSETPNGRKVPVGGSTAWYDVDYDEIYDEAIQEYGKGYYFVQTRILSKDLNTYHNSEWSAFSEPYYLTELAGNVEQKLDNITTNDPAEIKAQVQAIGTNDLKSAMLADTEGTAAIAAMKDLENKAGGPAAVSSKDIPQLPANEVSVVGANLNTVTGDSASLNISRPQKEHTVPAMYDNTAAVKFSMELEGVNYDKELDVPVEITMPVPENINPEFFVILHYPADGGEPETVHPYVYRENGKYYAKFVLTHFSDFIMTQKKQAQPEEYNVTLDAQNGTENIVLTTENGKLAELPVPEKAGYTFEGWYTQDGEKVTAEKVYTADTTLTAHWTENAVPVSHNITIIGGKGAASAKAGETVTITANRAERGYRFAGWTSEDGVEFKNASAKETTFVMPDRDVSVKAEFVKEKYSVTVENGFTFTKNAKPGAKVIVMTLPFGKGKFMGWTSENAVEFKKPQSVFTSFVMPAEDVVVTAEYRKK